MLQFLGKMTSYDFYLITLEKERERHREKERESNDFISVM